MLGIFEATGADAGAAVALRVEIVTTPPSGIASRALMARLTVTCSICWMSERIQILCTGCKVYPHVRSQKRGQPGKRRLQRDVQVHRLDIENLLTAEGEQLAGDGCCLCYRSLDLVEIDARECVGRKRTVQEFSRTGKHHQHIVEIVRDTTRFHRRVAWPPRKASRLVSTPSEFRRNA